MFEEHVSVYHKKSVVTGHKTPEHNKQVCIKDTNLENVLLRV